MGIQGTFLRKLSSIPERQTVGQGTLVGLSKNSASYGLFHWTTSNLQANWRHGSHCLVLLKAYEHLSLPED